MNNDNFKIISLSLNVIDKFKKTKKTKEIVFFAKENNEFNLKDIIESINDIIYHSEFNTLNSSNGLDGKISDNYLGVCYKKIIKSEIFDLKYLSQYSNLSFGVLMPETLIDDDELEKQNSAGLRATLVLINSLGDHFKDAEDYFLKTFLSFFI